MLPLSGVAGRFGAPSTVDLAKPALPPGRFLEQVPVFYPGIELVAEAGLTLEADPYLSDHELDATPILPAVMGLEAIAQSIAATADAVFTGNVGCSLQIIRHLREAKPDMWVAHPVDALWASYSGEMPKGQ